MEADKKDVLYLVGNELGGGTFPTDPVGNVGHYLHRSTDGGKTFTAGVEDGDGLGDIQIDRRNGTLYEAYYEGGTLSMVAYRKARKGNLEKKETNKIASGVSMLSHWPSFDLDSARQPLHDVGRERSGRPRRRGLVLVLDRRAEGRGRSRRASTPTTTPISGRGSPSATTARLRSPGWVPTKSSRITTRRPRAIRSGASTSLRR